MFRKLSNETKYQQLINIPIPEVPFGTIIRPTNRNVTRNTPFLIYNRF